tara:strand:+ start:2069 stop:5320 length:3252 start_codon:yes stop_codon:yes gene_type:complete
MNAIKLKKIKSGDLIKIKNNNDLSKYISEKIKTIENIVTNTSYSINIINKLNIFSNNDIQLFNKILSDILNKIYNFKSQLDNLNETYANEYIDELQEIINKLSTIISGYGTKYIKDILYITFGNDFNIPEFNDEILKSKYKIINEYIFPTGYKIVNWKNNVNKYNDDDCYCCNKMSDDNILIEESNILECFDIDHIIHYSTFYQINGIQFAIHNNKLKKTLIIKGFINEIHINTLFNKYIDFRKNELLQNAKSCSRNEKELFLRIIDTLTLKEFLIYGNEDIYKKMIKIISEIKIIKLTKIDDTIKKFLNLSFIEQRELIITILLYNQDTELMYICNLLYDLIEAEYINTNNSSNQLYDSFPFKIQEFFKENIKNTLIYKKKVLDKYDISKVSLEQQIYLLKVNDNIKEKAIIKLKEIAGKPDELCYKTKQYLEGLIKIPFGSYKNEPVLKIMDIINSLFIKLLTNINYNFKNFSYILKNKYTNVEINNYIINYHEYIKKNILLNISQLLDNQNIKELTKILKQINIIKKNNKQNRIQIANSNKPTLIDKIITFLTDNLNNLLPFILKLYDSIKPKSIFPITNTLNDCNLISNKINNINESMKNINDILDDSIYGHFFAKNQIMKIIAQWMNGEQTGYCFGFEGSPGIGKTSLAKKGLTNCLKDDNNISRPFNFIALGGSSNGSSLEGHGFTYMNSTWGKIVDVLMESKCMNPIIYIDELDKVSKTEQGKEIFGILTHLIDSTQNDCFQDKYFSGIDIDISKALFIFSYNDPEEIDKVLLDRIHRIKFDNLTIADKIIIVNKFLLPEINTKMGFENVVNISDTMIEYIIENYTLEPGVRKLKELLFDLYGEINLNILKPNKINIPIIINEENIENIYLTRYNKILTKKINETSEIGIINGLWANSLGLGGITPIQTLFYPSSTFLELQLTGLQGDVMKESMNVAKSLAWNLINDTIKKKWLLYFNDTKCQGLHIHCPEGGISKDGPSAGAAITTAIYSLLTEKHIKHNIGITGEINLNGEITAIGGLTHKINGGIKAGITTFLFPKSNHRDFIEWQKNNNDNNLSITFIEISNIKDVFHHVFV